MDMLEDEYISVNEINEELRIEEDFPNADQQRINEFINDEMIYDNLVDNESYDEQKLLSDKDDTEWIDSNTPIQLESFESFPGVQTVPTDYTDIFGLVDMLFSDEFFTFLTCETNRFYLQHFKKIKEYKIFNQLTKEPDITEYEMKSFMGIIILSSIMKFKKLQSLWKFPQNIIRGENFQLSINYDRFKHIWRYWHFNNNNIIMNDRNKLSKIQLILNHFLPKFQEMYNPERELYLNERVMPWTQIYCEQYLPSKFEPGDGILLTSLCECRSGYVINMDISTRDISKTSEQRLLSILRPIYGKWHFLYRLNFVNCIQDAKNLLNYKIRMCTVTQYEDNDTPEIFINLEKFMKNNGTVFRKKNDILALKHKTVNGRTFTCLSTIHDAQTIKIIAAPIHIKSTFSADIPVCILDHMKYMREHSPTDTYFVNYEKVGRFGKWSRKVVLYIINSALHNSFILYKKMNPKKILTYENYLCTIAKRWI